MIHGLGLILVLEIKLPNPWYCSLLTWHSLYYILVKNNQDK